jgi:hypothetical protein
MQIRIFALASGLITSLTVGLFTVSAFPTNAFRVQPSLDNLSSPTEIAHRGSGRIESFVMPSATRLG